MSQLRSYQDTILFFIVCVLLLGAAFSAFKSHTHLSNPLWAVNEPQEDGGFIPQRL